MFERKVRNGVIKYSWMGISYNPTMKEVTIQGMLDLDWK